MLHIFLNKFHFSYNIIYETCEKKNINPKLWSVILVHFMRNFFITYSSDFAYDEYSQAVKFPLILMR